MYAFLDDVYVVCELEGVRVVYDFLEDALERRAGIQLHRGKTRAWNRGGVKPPGLDDPGDGVWDFAAVVVLGTPLGSYEFVQ